MVDKKIIEEFRSDFEIGELIFDDNTEGNIIDNLESVLTNRALAMQTNINAIGNSKISFVIKDEPFYHAVHKGKLSFNVTSVIERCRLDVVLTMIELDPSGIYTLEHSSKNITMQHDVRDVQCSATPSDRFSFRGDRPF